VVVVLAVMLGLVACDGDDATTDEQPAPADDGAGADGATDDEEPVALPDVVLLGRDEVDLDAAPDTLDGTIASAVADLPDGWNAAVVPDAVLGPFVVGLPDGATVWRVGEDLGPLRDAVDDEPWLRYWDPILADASDAAEGASLRAVLVLPGGVDGTGGPAASSELHLTVSATPRQDLPVDDPAAVAEAFAETFREQQLEVETTTTERAGDDEVAAVTATTPDDEFDDGVARRFQQWFYPEPGTSVLWSVTCEGPAPDAATVDATCPVVLGSFRPPPR
jgi:hypothetical protein